MGIHPAILPVVESQGKKLVILGDWIPVNYSIPIPLAVLKGPGSIRCRGPFQRLRITAREPNSDCRKRANSLTLTNHAQVFLSTMSCDPMLRNATRPIIAARDSPGVKRTFAEGHLITAASME